MNRIGITILLLLFSAHSFCQVNLNGTQGNMIIFSLGAEKTFINNTGFNSWTELNYNKTERYLFSGDLDISLIKRSYDLGICLSAPSPYKLGAFYFGKKLTNPQSKISSFLNFEIGYFGAAYNDIAPANYVPTSSQKGKSLQLQYNATYIGLASKNYLNGLSFRSGEGRKGVSFNTGFFVDARYEPWGGEWEYGYYTGVGKYSSFKGTRVYGIPHLNDFFINAGIFFGIGS